MHRVEGREREGEAPIRPNTETREKRPSGRFVKAWQWIRTRGDFNPRREEP